MANGVVEKPDILDTLLDTYIQQKHFKDTAVNEDEVAAVTAAIKQKVLDEAYRYYTEEQINQAREKAEREAKERRRKLLAKVKRTLVIETIFLALTVSIIANQITNWISHVEVPDAPFLPSAITVIIGLMVCTLLVVIMASDSTEE